jgi:hypothetical protein
MWLTGRLAPDFKTIADFRRDNGPAIRATCRRFVEMCRRAEPVRPCVGAYDFTWLWRELGVGDERR